MRGTHRKMPLLALAVALVSSLPSAAQSATPVSFELGADVTGLTNFGSYFSLPVGLHLGGEYRIATGVPGLSAFTGALAGWWMESFRDTFNFHPELVPVMFPVAVDLGLAWEPHPAIVLEAGVQAGIVFELVPGARPTLLVLVSPGIGLTWFAGAHAGAGIRVGWAWVGADPVWSGPSLQAGPAFR